MGISRLVRRVKRSGALKWAGILGASFVATASILTIASPNRSQRLAPELPVGTMAPEEFAVEGFDDSPRGFGVRPNLDLAAIEAEPSRLAAALYAGYLQDMINAKSAALDKTNPFAAPDTLAGLSTLEGDLLVSTPLPVQSPSTMLVQSQMLPQVVDGQLLADTDLKDNVLSKQQLLELYIQGVDAGVGEAAGLAAAGAGGGSTSLTPLLIALGSIAAIGGIVALTADNQVAQAEDGTEIPIPTPALLPGLLATAAAALRRSKQATSEG